MAFIQTDLNYAIEYSKEMANVYPYLSYFSDLYGSPNSATYRPLYGKYIAYQSMTVAGAVDANRNGFTGGAQRNFNTHQNIAEMRMDRIFKTSVDPMDMREDPIVALANITKTFNEQQKIPEMDSYAASTLAAAASGFGGIDATALTAENILQYWDEYLAYMVNQRVPRDRIRCKMTPATYKLLKEAAGITRFVQADTGIRNVDRNVGKLDGVAIMEVPSDIMMSAYDFSDGWIPAAGAKQINILMFDPIAIAAPIVYQSSMVSAPTAYTDGQYAYFERYYYDVFPINTRLPGIFANVAAEPTISNNLTVTSVAGESGQTIVTLLQPVPYGMSAFYKTNSGSATTPAYGDDISSWTPFVNGAAITATSGNYITVALANTSGVPGGPAFATQYGTAVIVSGT